MSNETKQTISTDIDGEFLKDISLWKVIGNRRTVEKLKVITNEYHNNKSEGRRHKLSSVLLCGRKGAGKKVLAHCYSNSLCLNIFEADGATLSNGGECVYRFLQKGDQNSSYIVYNIEKLSGYSSYSINSALSKKFVAYHDFLESKIKDFKFNGLLILTCCDIKKVNSQIVKNIDVCCHLYLGYSDGEIERILMQRISYLSWEITNKDKFLDAIVNVADGDASLAIQILGWAHRCARSEGRDKIGIRHLNKAFRLLG